VLKAETIGIGALSVVTNICGCRIFVICDMMVDDDAIVKI
jgi:hypothetical protein